MDEFIITFDKFYQAFSPGAHLNSLTELGNFGHASAMQNVDILTPDYMTQGPALADLTNGTQAGAVTELINFILDRAVSDSVTYGIGATKLFKITPSAVTSDATWPQAITNCTDGESVIELLGNLYYFFNKSSGGEIGKYDLASTFDHDWGSTVPTGAGALQSALHPSAKKEDLCVFGNGRYAGTLNATTTTLALTKLDFGNGTEVADVDFFSNQWLLAVNSGISGVNRNKSQIYLWDGGAISPILSDEVAVGVQKIGWIYPFNGIVFLAFQDLSFSGGYKIGFVDGRRIKTVAHFTGSLPTYNQKTLYKNVILTVSSGLIYAAGSVIDQLPFAISQHADGGHATVGALAAPFGTPMVASFTGSSYRLAKFSGFDTACTWKSIIVPTIKGSKKGIIDELIVITNHLGTGARCDLVLQYNQQQSNSGTALQIKPTGTGNITARYHKFKNFKKPRVEDFNLSLDWSNGSATNDVRIRKIMAKIKYAT